MKLVIRIFALTVVVAGAAAAATTPSHKPVLASHQAANSAMPVPMCGPGLYCPPDNK